MIDFVYSFIRWFIPSFIGIHVGASMSWDKYDFIAMSIGFFLFSVFSWFIFIRDEDEREEYIPYFLFNFSFFVVFGFFGGIIESLSQG